MTPQALILQPNWFSLLPNQPLSWEALHVLSRTTKAVLVLLLYAGEHSQQQGKWHKAPSCNPWRACSLGLVYYPQCNSKSTAKHMAVVPRGFPSSGQPGQRVTLSLSLQSSFSLLFQQPYDQLGSLQYLTGCVYLSLQCLHLNSTGWNWNSVEFLIAKKNSEH